MWVVVRRSPEWRPPRRVKATNRAPGVKRVLKKRIELETPDSQDGSHSLNSYTLQRAEGIAETVYDPCVFLFGRGGIVRCGPVGMDAAALRF